MYKLYLNKRVKRHKSHDLCGLWTVMIKKILYLKFIYYFYNRNSGKNDCIGFQFEFNNKSINVKYKNKNYNLYIDKNKSKYYLKLTPYDNSFFSTEINLRELKMKANMTLYAIKKNEREYG